ncbi:MAG: hypothetical protein EOR74_23015 [Mesorhizobium sp.]|nr:MAG: hypothetical protein EOR74_23015 [Mesorhizobium sp.]
MGGACPWSRPTGQALCRGTGLEHLASASHQDRVQHAADYRARLAAAIAKRTLEAWAGLFDAIEIPWGHVHDLMPSQEIRSWAYETYLSGSAPKMGVNGT